MNSYSEVTQKIEEQIDFIKKERKSLMKNVVQFEPDSPCREALMKKAAHFEEIEQNMYALRVIAIQLLKIGD